MVNKLKAFEREQCAELVDAATGKALEETPHHGWIVTVRKALGMSGAALARRLGVTKPAVAQLERAELTGGITVAKLREVAEAMECEFVYALVPKDGQQVEEVIRDQAWKKASKTTAKAAQHMVLEAQSIDAYKQTQITAKLAGTLRVLMPRDFWDD